jgi:hypothetical protein
MRLLPSWLREFAEVAADDRQLAQEFLLDDVGDKTSAVGAKELSPALQRRVGVKFFSESRRDDRGKPCRAYGTPSFLPAHPALKRWAKLYRPASGTAFLPVVVTPPATPESQNRKSLLGFTKELS